MTLPGEEFLRRFLSTCCRVVFTQCGTTASGARAPPRRGCPCHSSWRPCASSLRSPRHRLRRVPSPHRCAHTAGEDTSTARDGSSARATSRQERHRHYHRHNPGRCVPTRSGCGHAPTTRTARPDASTRRARLPRYAPQTGRQGAARHHAPIDTHLDPARPTPDPSATPHGGEFARAAHSIARPPRFSATEVWRRLRDAKPLVCYTCPGCLRGR